MKIDDIKENHIYKLDFAKDDNTEEILWWCKVLKIDGKEIDYEILRNRVNGLDDDEEFVGEMSGFIMPFAGFAVEDLGEADV